MFERSTENVDAQNNGNAIAKYKLPSTAIRLFDMKLSRVFFYFASKSIKHSITHLMTLENAINKITYCSAI